MDENDFEEDIDDLIEPEPGYSRVYAVPRVRKCTSRLMIELLNLFGELKGFDLILDYLQRPQDKIEINMFAILLQCVSTPYGLYHKEFIKTFGVSVVKVAKD